MHLALTAFALTVAYIVLLLLDESAAVGVAGFYLAAVLILIGAQRFRCWLEERRA